MEPKDLFEIITKFTNNTAGNNQLLQALALTVLFPAMQQQCASQSTDSQSEKKATSHKKSRGRFARPGYTFKIAQKELNQMSDRNRKFFACNELVIPYRFHKGVFEVQFRRKGVYIYAAATTFQEMKKRFLEKASNFPPTIYAVKPSENLILPPPSAAPLNAGSINHILFTDYVAQWLEQKKETVKERTYKEYERIANCHFRKDFPSVPLIEMTRPVVQKYLFDIIHEGKFRTAEKLHLAFSCIFDLAAEDLGIRSPMKQIQLPYHESKKGKALTKQEERVLIDFCIQNKHLAASSALLVLLYFGLRRSELASISIQGESLSCISSKQRMGRNEVPRTIPFTPVFKRVLPFVDFEKAKNVNLNTIQTTLKRILPNHHPHELRNTFITRCKECGVNLEVVMLWDGHSSDKDVASSAVDRGYTDYSREFLLKEALKVDYEV